MVRYDGTMYNAFYDRHLIVTVSSEPGSPSSTVPEDKRVIPDDNVLNYEVRPGVTDHVIRISVSIQDLYFLHSILAFTLMVGSQEGYPVVKSSSGLRKVWFL